MPDNTDTLLYVGHRERLRQKFLDDKLAEYELLEMLLGYVIPRRDVRPLARGLIKQFGCMAAVIAAPIDDLMAFPGVGRNTAIFLKSLHNVTLMEYRAKMSNTPVFHDTNLLTNYCRTKLIGKTIEEFHVLYLDRNMMLIAEDVHSTGTFNETAMYPREIARRAMDVGARNVVVMHNHPMSDNSFSVDDQMMTWKLQDLLEMLDIILYDHFVVTRNGIVYSGKQARLLDKKCRNITNR